MASFKTLVELQPFSRNELPEQDRNLVLNCELHLHDSLLKFVYTISSSENITWPVPAISARRLTGLWDTTCFESFIGLPEGQRYWEMNASPSGDWNFFVFEDYRREMREEEDVYNVKIQTTLGENSKRFVTAELDLATISVIHDCIMKSQPLPVSVTAVVAHSSGQKSYWATKHSGEKPDFHLRKSFVIQLV